MATNESEAVEQTKGLPLEKPTASLSQGGRFFGKGVYETASKKRPRCFYEKTRASSARVFFVCAQQGCWGQGMKSGLWGEGATRG
jgi:hypothetical protein